MRRLIHISDLHFGTDIPAVTEALVRDISAVAPDVIAVSGDITQRARSSEYENAAAFLRSFSAPIVVVPGNHDIPLFNPFRRLLQPFNRFKNTLGTYSNSNDTPYFCDDEIAVVGINTVNPLQWKHGVFHSEDIEILQRGFAQCPAAPWKVAVMHHPVELYARTAESRVLREKILRRGGKALDILQEVGVNVILAGHLHQSNIEELHTSLSTLTSPMLMLQAGTALSARVRREGNSYNVLTLEGNTCHVGVRVFDGVVFREQRSHTFLKK
jgi:3',5'-cyclic AMP phosphodiesterase CpdA